MSARAAVAGSAVFHRLWAAVNDLQARESASSSVEVTTVVGPLIRDGCVAEHVYCRRCDYDLFGSVWPCCPECGAVGEYYRRTATPRINPRWSLAVLVFSVAVLPAWIVFYALLWTHGLGMMDLWGSGRIRPVRAAALPFIPVALRLLQVSFYHVVVSLTATIALVFAAVAREDRRTRTIGALALLATAASGLLWFVNGLVLGGV